MLLISIGISVLASFLIVVKLDNPKSFSTLKIGSIWYMLSLSEEEGYLSIGKIELGGGTDKDPDDRSETVCLDDPK